MQTTVYQVGPPRHDIVGQSLPRSLTVTEQTISPGLASRIFNYAQKRMQEMGLPTPENWAVSVETIDANLKPSERNYFVTWTTPEGTEIGIEGILTRNGWPCLDHGPFVQSN